MPDRGEPFSIEICSDDSAADALAALGAATFIDAFGHLYRAADLEAFLREHHSPGGYRRLIADPETRIWIAKDAGGAPVAYAVARPCTLPVEDMPPRSGELSRLYALKAHQGAGLGGRLLETALDWLEVRFDHVFLSVYAENDGAMRLYRRHGFEKAGAYSFMVGDHADPEFIMKRTSKGVISTVWADR